MSKNQCESSVHILRRPWADQGLFISWGRLKYRLVFVLNFCNTFIICWPIYFATNIRNIYSGVYFITAAYIRNENSPSKPRGHCLLVVVLYFWGLCFNPVTHRQEWSPDSSWHLKLYKICRIWGFWLERRWQIHFRSFAPQVCQLFFSFLIIKKFQNQTSVLIQYLICMLKIRF